MSEVEKFYNRFKEYSKIDTTSSEVFSDKPSNENEFVLANLLKKQLEELGLIDLYINKFATVYGYFPGNDENNKDSIALIAHLDTSNQANGKDIKARLVKFDGSDILLSNNIYLSKLDYPVLRNKIGHNLIVSDGTTLLGGDDKAGITIIMELIEYLVNNKNVKHCPIEVIFTSDEEIGVGADHVDIDKIKSKFGYTIDGGDLRYIEAENFNGASMKVIINGRAIHPGYAKDKMINAINVGIKFHNSLPEFLRPEDTSNRQGFYHLSDINGNEEKTVMDYIIREHDINKLNYMIEIANLSKERINNVYKKDIISLDIKLAYKNMKPELDKHKEVVDKIEKAYQNLNISYEFEAIRGGTDGASLTYKGLPCPNIATGSYNYHSRFEFIDVDESICVINILKEIVTNK